MARVRCHRNTWAYLEENVPKATVAPRTAFCAPTEEEITTEEDGMVTVALAGTSLAAVLHFCRDVHTHLMTASWTELDRAIARRVGSAISEAMNNVIPSNGEDGPTALIYLDDKITAKDATA
ncbi:hypothetical protein [Streptomyces flavidovirens]|uniref:Uncharacterized protein n=1 Tax=Streptomyces flavidovirens TaxID=67298 RepID=A0ABW6RA21_9ACTN